jgi:hypothetical protein
MGYEAPEASSESGPRQRTSRDAFLHRQVRWRLFRTDEMPARLRRLERLERAAEQSLEPLTAPGRPPGGEP